MAAGSAKPRKVDGDEVIMTSFQAYWRRHHSGPLGVGAKQNGAAGPAYVR